MNLPLPRPALEALNNLIARTLELDSRARDRLMKLDGERFRIISTRPPLEIDITVADNSLQIQTTDAALPAGTTVTGDWLEFGRVATARDPASALINGDITVGGDTSALLELREIMMSLDLDWEAPLARLVGDVAAHQIGRGLRGAPRIAGQLFGHLRRQVKEFIVEESGAVPHPIEVEDFGRDVQQLAERCDRLEARVQRLQRK